ncbi:MAG TPA: sn-glycerol-3-phosphate ABC transporter ATP-binding protein UgpC [Actinokineospora sp.]|nr:sn-glycerol-3-phosphate ABC transporter ATP-binding protein UgpC [Actinokineospora sp.]
MAGVVFDGVTRQYPGVAEPALVELDLEVADGELMVLVGPSGCGKSTTLRMVAGLEPADGGKIRIGRRDVTDVLPKDRDIAMVFQNYALYPHMTVAQNIGFHLLITKMDPAECERRVLAAAKLLDLEPYLDRKPAKLSGGQRQRVAMGRAIVRRPQVFLMDEPLSNLDAKLRVQTRMQIASLQRRLGVTTLYVTHDQVEAMTMGDRVAVLDKGVLQQCDTPLELFARPANLFVAGFIGTPAMNLVPARLLHDGITLGGIRVRVPPERLFGLTSPEVVVGVRPEGWRVAPPDSRGLVATVEVIEELGNEGLLHCATEVGTAKAAITVRIAGASRARRGDLINLLPIADSLHFFDARTGQRIGV